MKKIIGGAMLSIAALGLFGLVAIDLGMWWAVGIFLASVLSATWIIVAVILLVDE